MVDVRFVAIVAVACSAHGKPAPIDPARFAPRLEWTAESYAIHPVTPPKRLSTNDAIEDLAYLEPMLDHAWAWNRTVYPDFVAEIRKAMRETVREPRSPQQWCELLAWAAQQGQDTASLAFSLAGKSCDSSANKPRSPEHLATTVGAFDWRIDRDAGGDEVGILTIDHFDAHAPGWADALREVVRTERVVIDMQAASATEDPEPALQLIAALGMEAYGDNLQPPQIRTGPFVDVARANAGTTAQRSEAWAQLLTPELARQAARKDFALDRKEPVLAAQFLVGPGCGVTCQLVLTMAVRYRQRFYGTAVSDLSIGDQRGLVRLPHSGIDVAFPTAAYGPAILWRFTTYDNDPGFAAHALADLHALGNQRRGAEAWRHKPLPSCAALTPDPKALAAKQTGCPDRASEATNIFVVLDLDDDLASQFVEGCIPIDGVFNTTGKWPDRTATIRFGLPTPDVLQRIAAAPFVRSISYGCPAP